MNKIQNAISLRFFNVYGENQNPQYAGVITKFIERLSKGLAPTIFGDGEQTRDFIHVGDVVDAIISASSFKHDIKDLDEARNWLSSSTTFNVGTGYPTSINRLADKLIKIFGLNLKPVFTKMVAGRNTEALLRKYRKVSQISKFCSEGEFRVKSASNGRSHHM